MEKKGEGLLPIAAMEANYSKSSLMTFAMFEILLQTLSYINSHEFRGNSRLKPMYKDFARKLKRVVFTCPTAMLEEEKKILREHAEDAVRLLKDYFPSSLVDEVEIIPSAKDIGVDKTKRKNWGYDEATCNQLAFVYGEIMHRFRGDAGLFFKYSQVWQDYLKEKNAVRIASIDIGGGTTDVMVCEYSRDPDAHIVVLSPDPLFW
ncbi:MAG: virulence factor SrfB, partial [Butyricimonas faecihominis]